MGKEVMRQVSPKVVLTCPTPCLGESGLPHHKVKAAELTASPPDMAKMTEGPGLLSRTAGWDFKTFLWKSWP